jgi:hypothetical protein
MAGSISESPAACNRLFHTSSWDSTLRNWGVATPGSKKQRIFWTRFPAKLFAERELHYSAVNRSDVPQGRKGKHRKAVSDILGDLSKTESRGGGQNPAEHSERREDAESPVSFEPRHTRQEYP